MSGLGQMPPFSFIDLFWRTTFRIGFPIARVWWRLRRKRHVGALVAVYVGQALLLVRSSYRVEWNFPGGGVRQGEMPEDAARRELIEELGLTASALVPAGVACGLWDGQRDTVYFFELRLNHIPRLKLDNREIIDARLIPPDDWCSMALTGAVAAYMHGLTVPVDSVVS